MKPIVGLVCDSHSNGKHLYHQVGDKYIAALVECAGVTPILFPSLEKPVATHEFLDLVDGMLFTGAYANVQRQLYGLPAAPEGEIEDPLRDQNVLPMIRATLDRGIPMLGICRGFQELNVVFGGTLFPRVHEIEGRMDHRENPEDPIEVQYGPAHNVTPTQGGLLADLLGAEPFDVNSIHMQGVDRVGEGLVVEALANDGTVEALSVAEAKGFALAVQWHPEWRATENEQSKIIYEAFRKAASAYQGERLGTASQLKDASA